MKFAWLSNSHGIGYSLSTLLGLTLAITASETAARWVGFSMSVDIFMAVYRRCLGVGLGALFGAIPTMAFNVLAGCLVYVLLRSRTYYGIILLGLPQIVFPLVFLSNGVLDNALGYAAPAFASVIGSYFGRIIWPADTMPGRCKRCGYDLRGNDGPVCSECGNNSIDFARQPGRVGTK